MSGATRPVAIVTGASYGIGAACAEALALDGFDIVATELEDGELAGLAAMVESAGAQILTLPLDVRDRSSIDAIVEASFERFGHVDALVNNAGRPLFASALETAYDEFLDVLQINVAGSFFMAQAVARRLIESGRPGSITSIASTHSVVGGRTVAAYGISKTAVSGMTRHLAVEWSEHGIRVNAVAPGAVATKLRKASFDANPAFRDAHIEQIPLKRLCTPEDVAAAVVWLSSPQAAYVTGHVLVVDGGLTVS